MIAKNNILINPKTTASVAFEVRRTEKISIIDFYDTDILKSTLKCDLDVANKLYTEYIEAGYKVAF